MPGGGSYVPQNRQDSDYSSRDTGGVNPFERMRDMVNQQSGRRGSGQIGGQSNPGGFIRDMIGSALGGKSKGIMGSILGFLIYRYGWSFVKRILGRALGGR